MIFRRSSNVAGPAGRGLGVLFVGLLLMAAHASGADVLNGELTVVIDDAIVKHRGERPSELHPLNLEIVVHDGKTAPVWGFSDGFNRADHVGRVAELAVDGDSIRMRIEMRIEGDPWIPGGRGIYDISLKRDDRGDLSGTYEGRFVGRETRQLAGQATGQVLPLRQPVVEGFEPVQPQEHPRILFRRSDLPALREKAESPFGQPLVARLRAAADAADAENASLDQARNGAVAMGVLYQLDQDADWARRAMPVVDRLVASGYHMGANNLPEPFGYNIARIAMTYDLCLDAWPEDFRQKISNHLMWMSDRLMSRPNTVSTKMNWDPGSNYQPGTRGGAAIATLALLGGRGPAPAEPSAPKGELVRIAPPDDLQIGGGVPVIELQSGALPMQFLYSGPFHSSGRQALLEQLGGPAAARPDANTTLRHGDATIAFSPLDGEVIVNTRYTGGRDAIDLRRLVRQAQNTTSLLYAVIDNPRERVFAVRRSHDAVDLWIAGQQVTDDTFIHLPAGRYPLLMQVTAGTPGQNIQPQLNATTVEAAEHELERRQFEHQQALVDYREARAEWEANGGLDPQKARLVRIGQRHMARYFQYMMGDGGWQAEGEGYTLWSVPLALEYAHAHRTAFGISPSPRPDVTMFAPRYVAQGVFAENGRRVRSQSWGHSEGTLSAAHYARVFSVTHEPFKPAVLWAWNHVMGVQVDDSPQEDDLPKADVNNPLDALFTLINYPLNLRPQNPDAVMPRAFAAPGRGGYIFRNGWSGADDIVAQVFLKTMPPTGWNQPNAGSLRIQGLGHVWALKGNQPKSGDRTFENVVLLPEDPIVTNAGARPLFYEARRDGSGSISIDMNLVYSGRKTIEQDGRSVELDYVSNNAYDRGALADLGIRGIRAFAADYSGRSGSPGLFVLADRIEGGRSKIWAWQLPTTGGRNSRVTADVSVEGNRFTIRQGDATLVGTFITPSDVNIQVIDGQVELRVVVSASRMTWGQKTFQTGALHASGGQDKSAGDFLVVMTLQRGEAPPVRVDGQGLDVTVHVGPQRVRFDGRRIMIGPEQESNASEEQAND